MPRKCSVCTHPQRTAIETAMVDQAEYRDIARQFGLSKDAVARHKESHLPARLAIAKEAQEVANGTDLLQELRTIGERVRLLSDACDRWLRDPDDPERYDIGPRAEEVQVTYLEYVGDKPVRRKKRLSELLSLALDGPSVLLVETKYADPRDLVLKAYDRLQGQLELIAKLIGELDERPQVNVLVNPQWITVRTALLSALAPYPEARSAVATALLAVDP
jgi:hypothetical protein